MRLEKNTCQAYIDLPPSQREKYGFYIKPFALGFSEWKIIEDFWRKNYPIQFFFRETVSFWFYLKYRSFRDFWTKIKCFFRPWHQDIRNCIPKTWIDSSELIRIINFAIITEFYHKELLKIGKGNSEFEKWLESAIKYIEIDRPQLEKDLDNAYPKANLLSDNIHSKEDYVKIYGQVERLENLIKENDTLVLNNLVKYRDNFWT